MKIRLAVLAVLMCAVGAQGQAVPSSDTFTFGAGAQCSSITTWNGVSGAYPQDMGAICLFQGDENGGYGSFLDVPWQLGFLNNGYLAGCDPLTWQPKVFTLGDGTHNGDTFTVAGATTCPYYTGEYGTYEDSNNRLDGFSVVASYTVVARRSCGRFGCHTYLSNVLTGGTGVVSEALLNQ
jgi:hypothetical protein